MLVQYQGCFSTKFDMYAGHLVSDPECRSVYSNYSIDDEYNKQPSALS